MCNKKEKEEFIFTIPLNNFTKNKRKLSIIEKLSVDVTWGVLNNNGDVVIHVGYVGNREKAKEAVKRFARECKVEFSQFPCYSCVNVLCVFNNTPEALLPTNDNAKGEVEIFTCLNANCREKEEED